MQHFVRDLFLSVMRCIMLVVIASFCEAIGAAQSERTEPQYPAPGQLVDIGGWRMHINCSGEAKTGQPTVVLEAGASGFSVDWSLVQPQVATFARICSYDRSGSAWSDLGPYPHTMRQIVYELHTLLEKAGVTNPYVLVGHSFGGRLVRLYATTYPSEVVGMVLVDAGHEDDLLFINGKLLREWETATGQSIPPVKTSMPLREDEIPPDIRRQIEATARQAAPQANDPPYNKLPAHAQQARRWALSQLGHYAANNSPFTGDEMALMRAERQKSDYPLGGMPLVVLSRGIPISDGLGAQQRQQERTKHQADLATLSRNGRQVIASRSGHHIHIDEPEVVVKAIGEVLGELRRQGNLTK